MFTWMIIMGCVSGFTLSYKTIYSTKLKYCNILTWTWQLDVNILNEGKAPFVIVVGCVKKYG